MRVHHIGYIVKDINKAISSFEQLGYKKMADIYEDKTRGINICFLKNENVSGELIISLADKSDVYNLQKQLKNGAEPYHMCYEIEDKEKDYKSLEDSGFIPISKKSPAGAISKLDGRPAFVRFYMHRDIGMIETLEYEE